MKNDGAKRSIIPELADEVLPDEVAIRSEGTAEAIALTCRQADESGVEHSEPITTAEPLGSPQSAIVGAIALNLQIVDLVFKTATDAIAMLTALSASVRIPETNTQLAIENVKTGAVADPAFDSPADWRDAERRLFFHLHRTNDLPCQGCFRQVARMRFSYRPGKCGDCSH